MQRFVKKIVDLMREEMLLSWQGGPVIMMQVDDNDTLTTVEGILGVLDGVDFFI